MTGRHSTTLDRTRYPIGRTAYAVLLHEDDNPVNAGAERVHGQLAVSFHGGPIPAGLDVTCHFVPDHDRPSDTFAARRSGIHRLSVIVDGEETVMIPLGASRYRHLITGDTVTVTWSP